MARPEEKAQAMLNKWTKMRNEENGIGAAGRRHNNERRPFLASQCEHLADAEKWRRGIVREISVGIRKIQNPGLGEHAIRDLNDEINKLIREKWHWNKRIKQLGGLDYNALERKQQAEEGDVQNGLGLKGSGGYRYFGAAKDLPGVKELFARHASKVTKRKRGDIYKYITPDYYGLRDEEDGVLLELEHQAEQKCRFDLGINDEQQKEEDDDDDCLGLGGITGAADAIAAHVAVPTQDIVAKTLLERKKKDLLDRLS